MPLVDRIIQFLQTQHGERIVLENDQPCVIHRGGAGTPTKDILSYQQLFGLVNEILPADQRGAFNSGTPFCFQYPSSAGVVDVDVSRADGLIRVTVGAPHAAAATHAAPAAAPLPDFELPAAPASPDTPASHQAEEHLPPPPVAHAQPVHHGPEKRVHHIDELFNLLRLKEGSDLHLSANEKPMMRIHGNMVKLEDYEVTTPGHLKKLLWDIAPKRNQEEWERDHDTDFAYELQDVARFRCNIFADRHGPGAVFRLIPSKIATVKDLNLTQAMLDLCYLSKGLVVVTGPTGSGKSTTLAALVDYINKHRDDHIITIEDPVEFVHNNIRCLVNQREVHVHTNSFSRALRAALREDPDIVLVGEMRDLETVAIAIETAETGHLVFGTLHTTTAATTVDRIIDQFPADQQEQIRVMLSESLKGVIAQTLCRTKDGRRAAAFEILIVDPACANLIREGKTYQLPSMMQIGKNRGCITMNDSLFALVKAGKVDPNEAYLRAVDKTGLAGMFEKEGFKLEAHAA